MRNRFRALLICFLFLFLSECFANAESRIQISASVDKNKLSQDQTLTLKIEITGEISSSPEVQLPDLDKYFEILSTAQSQNMSLKGKQSKLIISFRYILLPKQAGKIMIGSIQAKYNKEIYQTEPIEIEVTASSKPKIPKQEILPEENAEETIL